MEKIIQNINMEPTEFDRSKKVEFANDEIVKVHKPINLTFKLQEDKNNSYRNKFYVMNNQNNYPILGMRFLMENDAVIIINKKSCYIRRNGI